jgi:hypothetical protein
MEVISEREEKGKLSVERRYYITCLDAKADRLARIIPSHWGMHFFLAKKEGSGSCLSEE